MLSYGFFFSPDNSNVISRIGLTLGIVQRHALTIGPLADYTLDQATVDGVAYSDKAPGLSFLAVPITLLIDGMLTAQVDRPGPNLAVITYCATLGTVSTIAAFAVVALYRWSRSRNASHTASLMAALILGFATPFWGWATVFFGHAASGGLLLLGFAGLSTAIQQTPKHASEPERQTLAISENPAPRRAFLSGLALGAAFVVEFPAGPAVAIIGICCAVQAFASTDRWKLLTRAFLPAAAGLAIALAPLLAYNQAAFGSPWKIGYMTVQGFPGMQTGLFGISRPDPKVIVALLFGWNRGLFPLSPVLALFPLAIAACLHDRSWRLAAVTSTLIAAWYLAMNAGYSYWNGGDSTGPRHIVSALPFIALPLAHLWDASRRPLRSLLVLLLIVSVITSLACVSVDMWISPTIVRPLQDSLLPRFLDGDLPRTLTTRLFGWHGALALLPLAAAWSIIALPPLMRRYANPS
jgi:hypothetical protein